MDGFLDCVLVQAVEEKILSCLRQVTYLLTFIFFKDGSSCNAIPERNEKELTQLALAFWGDSPMALIYDKGEIEVLDPMKLLGMTAFVKLANHGIDFLDSGNHHSPFICKEISHQMPGNIRHVNIDHIIFGIRENGGCGLLIQVRAVNDEDGLVNRRNLQEVT